MVFKIKLFGILILLFANNSAFSQSVVHAENNRLAGQKEGFSGNIEMGLSFVQNVNNVLQSQNSSQFQYMHKQHNLLSLNAINLTIFNESRVLNDGFQHLRYGYHWKKNITLEVFGQIQYNEIIKIRNRILGGIGPRFMLVETKEDSVRVFLGVNYMAEYEEETTNIINRHHRLNSSLSLGWPITENIQLDFIGYYQPDFARFNDFRISTELTLKIKLIKRLSFKYSMAYFYDSFPPDGIRNVFYNIRNTLSFDL